MREPREEDPRYRWTAEAFVAAYDAGVFDGRRIELVEGELWRASRGDWSGRASVCAVLACAGHGEVTTASLVIGEHSMTLPDVWLRRRDARPVGRVVRDVHAWSPADVLLVVEVGDETLQADLTTKAALYGRSGYERYWVVSRRGVHEHTGPTPEGYRQVRLHVPGERVVLPDGRDIAVDDLLPDAD